MTASRRRRVLIIGVFAALFALGGGYLTYLATSSSGSSAASSEAGEPSALASSGGSSPDGAGAPGADSSGGGEGDAGPPKPQRDAPTTGINLDGNVDTECVAVLLFTDSDTNTVQVPLRVASAQVTSTSGALVADPGGCSNCVGARLGPGEGECQVGVRLSGDMPYPDPIKVTVTLTMFATCTDAGLRPCGVVAGRSPSAARPIGIRVIGTLTREIPPPEREDPRSPTRRESVTPDPGESPSSPDTESVPEPASSGAVS